MAKCARCGSDVDTVHTVTPDVITKELIESIDEGEEDMSGRESSMTVCAECMDGLTGD